METFKKLLSRKSFKIKLILKVFTVVFCVALACYLMSFLNSSKSIRPSKNFQVETSSNPIPNLNQIQKTPLKADGIINLYPTKENGRTWSDSWANGLSRKLISGQSDPSDKEFVERGNGTVSIDGKGIADLSGDAPRMYVLDPKRKETWQNVEVTVYAKRINETDSLSSQGIVIGARSEHQDATLANPCLGATYYGRLLYDGRAVFQKEVIHEGAYSINMPSEKNRATWPTIDGTMPKNKWIGVKFIVKNNPDNKSVKLELYRDLTDGQNGGTWEKVAEYTDSGDWSQTDSNTNIAKVCGYGANKILINPGTSVFIRNDKIKDMLYKSFSIREIK